jgi:hypothetical protein
MTIDEWAIRAHEVVHSSEVIAQSYSTFNESGDPMGPRVQMTERKSQADTQASLDYDLKKTYSLFLDIGIDAYMYFGKVVAGFTLKELTAFGKTDIDPDTPDSEWKVRESIERGRSEWGEALYRIGIRAEWR